jgi:hypothetical protein
LERKPESFRNCNNLRVFCAWEVSSVGVAGLDSPVVDHHGQPHRPGFRNLTLR